MKTLHDTIVRVYPEMIAVAKVYLTYYGRPDIEAEDVVQEAVLNILERNVSVSEDMERYLYGATIHAMIDMIRKDKSQRGTEEAYARMQEKTCEMDGTLPGGKPVDAESMIAALKAMNPRTLGILIGSRIEGRTYKELAKEFNITPSSVAVIVHRSLLAAKETYKTLTKEKDW